MSSLMLSDVAVPAGTAARSESSFPAGSFPNTPSALPEAASYAGLACGFVRPLAAGRKPKHFPDEGPNNEASRKKLPDPTAAAPDPRPGSSASPSADVKPLTPGEQQEVIAQFRELGIVRLFQLLGGQSSSERSARHLATAALGFRSWMDDLGNPTDPLERKLCEMLLFTTTMGPEFLQRAQQTNIVPQAALYNGAAVRLIAESRKLTLAIVQLRECRERGAAGQEEPTAPPHQSPTSQQTSKPAQSPQPTTVAVVGSANDCDPSPAQNEVSRVA